MIDPSDNPMKVFRELVGEENLTDEQRTRIAEGEAYCDELVCSACGAPEGMMHAPKCPVLLEALARDDPRFPGVKFLGVVEDGVKLEYKG